jgi:hypothetical protein
MYITADGDEDIKSSPMTIPNKIHADIGSGFDRYVPDSVQSDDVKKAGSIVTQTPRSLRKQKNGRERLLGYLKNVEASIAREVAARKADIIAIKAQMAKNMELNAAARKKMKTGLLKKMAANAKKAKDDLDAAMRRTQRKFAKTAEFENKRYSHNKARSAKTREIMRKNKHEAQHNLQMATLAQQRSLAALAAKTAAKIKSTKLRIHDNANQIVANAKAARKALDHQMGAFDKKMANIGEEAKKGRSKLAAQAATQNKKFREWANNKVKAAVAKTAAGFAKVRKKMAADRAHADKEIAASAKRMDAALKAQAALNNRRFAKTVADIKAAKAEAAARVKAFKTSFKASILGLQGVAEEQIKKLHKRNTELSKTVENNKLAQARVNNKVSKELDAMVKLGKKRYEEGIAKDAELAKLMAKNAAETAARMQRMKNNFLNGLDKIKKQMKKDRAHAEHALAKTTHNLYATLKANALAQKAVNKKIAGATVAAKKEAAHNLKLAKDGFMMSLGKMHATVNHMEAKHNGQLLKLTGIVEANAIKDKKGRDQLKKVQAFNKAQVQGALSDAIKKGEQRALQIEKSQKKINNKMRTDLNTRIVTEISSLKAKIGKQLLLLRYNTPASRALMKKQVDAAITVARHKAHVAFKHTISDTEDAISKINSLLLHAKGKKKKALVAQKAAAAAKLYDSVAGLYKAELAFKAEDVAPDGFVHKKKKHTATTAAEKMLADAKAVEASFKSMVHDVFIKLDKAKKKAVEELEPVSVAAAKRYAGVVVEVEEMISASVKKASKVYVGSYTTMADRRLHLAEDLSSAISKLNDDIAKYAALQNSAFSKTVKNIGAARKAAASDMMNSRKIMTSTLFACVATIEEVETRLMGEIAVVSGYLMSNAAAANRIAKAVKDELKAIMDEANTRTSSSHRAKGVLKKLMDENKIAAASEVSQIFAKATIGMIEAKGRFGNALSDFKDDLKKATAKYYKALATKGKTVGKAKKDFGVQINSIANAVSSFQNKFEHSLGDMTGVEFSFGKASPTDIACIGTLKTAMKACMHKTIVRAIQMGVLKADDELSDEGVTGALLTTTCAAVESTADTAFAGVQGNRKKIADNYLSLKAYAMSAGDKVADYVAKGKGRFLSSIGDLLQTVGGLGDQDIIPAAGMGFGTGSVELLFAGGPGATLKVPEKRTKINALVNEYVDTLAQVRQRWPMGLGKYLLSRVEGAMMGTGLLEVDKVATKSGNFVFVNGHAVGLSASVSFFEALATRMSLYEATLAKLTGNLAKPLPGANAVKVYAKPPEWQGN